MIAGSFSDRQARWLTLVALMGLLGGCSAMQSNVRGGFACAAPDGTCAPSTMIDDAALGAMHRAEQARATARNKAEGADLVLGDEAPPEGDAMIVSTLPATLPATGRHTARDRSTAPEGHALKVVYPAYQDRDGHAHPRRFAYALVDTSAWASALKGRGHLGASASSPPSREGLLGAALHAPPLGILGREADAGQHPVNPPAAMAEGQGGSDAVVSREGPASALDKAVNPTARIEAEVSALLARRRAAGAGTFSGKVE